MLSGDTIHPCNRFAPRIVDLFITYHSLKIHLTQKVEEIGYFTLIGEQKEMAVLRKTEIAQDMVRFLQATPF